MGVTSWEAFGVLTYYTIKEIIKIMQRFSKCRRISESPLQKPREEGDDGNPLIVVENILSSCEAGREAIIRNRGGDNHRGSVNNVCDTIKQHM